MASPGSRFARLAEYAGSTDTVFGHASDAFRQLVSRYGWQFSRLSTYQDTWNGYVSRWPSMVQSTKNQATKSAKFLGGYKSTLLDIMEKVKDERDMPAAKERLATYVRWHPAEMPADIAGTFLNFRRELQTFRNDVESYLSYSADAKMTFSAANGYFQMVDKIANQFDLAWDEFSRHGRELGNVLREISEATYLLKFQPLVKFANDLAAELQPELEAYTALTPQSPF